ncbi:hypothetical protein BDQ17DRAFT_621385 [Cyathus striatus]|nr:hypothetical protein BDQ17DRAFT_621385 [Cyathus striatus]
MTSVKEAVGTFRWTPMKSKDVPKVGDKSTFGGAAGDEETENAKAKIDKRTVKMKHLLAALDEVPGSLTNNTTGQSELHRWHTQYGAGASSRPNHGAGIGRFGGYTGASSKTGAGSYSSVGDSTGAGGHGLGGGGAGAGKYDLGGGAGAGGYGLGRNATGAGGYGLGGNTSSAGGHGLGGNTTGAGGYGIGANRFGAGSGSGYGVGGSSIFGSGTGGNGHNSGIANSNAAGAALDANASSSSPLNIPRYPYGRNPGASGGYGSNSNTPASGAEPNPSGENFNPGQLPGRYHEYGALNGNGSSGILGGDGTTSGLPRYGGLFGGGIGGGIGSGGPNSFGAGGLGIVGAGGVLGGLGSVHGMGGFGSAGDNGHGPHASIEQVDEQS